MERRGSYIRVYNQARVGEVSEIPTDLSLAGRNLMYGVAGEKATGHSNIGRLMTLLRAVSGSQIESVGRH